MLSIDSYISSHSSEIRGLCSTQCSRETLQNLPYFWNTLIFFRKQRMKIPTSLRYQIFNSGCLFCCLASKIWTSAVAYLLYKKFKFMSWNFHLNHLAQDLGICTVVCKVGSYIIENFNYKTDFLKEFLTNAIFFTSHSCLELQELLLIFQ